MNAFFTFINSSVGRKILMSLTGILMCLFLIEHLIGNLLLLKFDGGIAFDQYAHFMGGNPIVRTLEVGLLLLFLIHILNGARIWLTNRRKREKKYEEYRLLDNTKLASRMMNVSASFVFLFLVIHLERFWVPARFEDPASIAALVYSTFRQPLYVSFYIFSLILLGYHLRHGFQSAFQTLGWRSSRYIGIIDFIAVLFWLVIPLGFALIPLAIYFAAGSALVSVH
jgi:succinate dehydrogenase / fumarate reductase cytochrome b subunit